MKLSQTTALAGLLSLVGGGMIHADNPKPLLHPLFADHAVLQRDAKVPVWGWTEPGGRVRVSFAGQKKDAVAGDDGRWSAILDLMPASSEGRTLEVRSEIDDLKAQIRDVLVGDIWLCSGQSNMEMGITLCREDDEIAQASDQGIRLLTIPQKTAFEPQETFSASWKPCSPQALRDGGWGGFSAAAYFFGNPLFPALCSGPTAGSGVARQKQFPSSKAIS